MPTEAFQKYMKNPFQDPTVAAKFESYPANPRRKLLALRDLVFRVATQTAGAGELEESLKWGEPAYATKNKAGSTIRMDWKSKSPNHFALYFNCQTNLVDSFRILFPDELRFEANRAIVFDLDDPVDEDAIAVCIAAALTYRLRKAK